MSGAHKKHKSFTKKGPGRVHSYLSKSASGLPKGTAKWFHTFPEMRAREAGR